MNRVRSEIYPFLLSLSVFGLCGCATVHEISDEIVVGKVSGIFGLDYLGSEKGVSVYGKGMEQNGLHAYEFQFCASNGPRTYVKAEGELGLPDATKVHAVDGSSHPLEFDVVLPPGKDSRVVKTVNWVGPKQSWADISIKSVHVGGLARGDEILIKKLGSKAKPFDGKPAAYALVKDFVKYKGVEMAAIWVLDKNQPRTSPQYFRQTYYLEPADNGAWDTQGLVKMRTVQDDSVLLIFHDTHPGEYVSNTVVYVVNTSSVADTNKP